MDLAAALVTYKANMKKNVIHPLIDQRTKENLAGS